MRRTLLLFFILSLVTLSHITVFGQEETNYLFYSSDTLKGFDLKACLSQAHALKVTVSDMRGYMKHQEMQFVKDKYHLIFPAVSRNAVNSLVPLSGSCSNVGFETGDFTNWTAVWGENDNSTLPLATPTNAFINLGNNSAETSCSYETLVNTGTDYFGGFPMLCPNGSFWSCRLGGRFANSESGTTTCQVTNSFASPGEFIQQSFPVTASNDLLTYSYAVVFESAPHSSTQCPYFRVEVLNNAGNPIPGMQLFLQSDSTQPVGFVRSPQTNQGDYVYYTNWRTVSLNLKPYLGQTVTIRFTAAGCYAGGHMGYAYVDASCGTIGISTTSSVACQSQAVTLTAPLDGPGETYQWSTVPPGNPGIVGSSTSQSVTVNASARYEVLVTPAAGNPYSLDTTISFQPSPTVTPSSTNASCGTCSDGTASVIASGGVGTLTYSWSGGTIGAGQGTPNASGLIPGTYTCCVTASNGCSVCQPTTVQFTTGIASLQTTAQTFGVYPNPFTNTLKLDIGSQTKDAEVVLYDVVGKEIIRQDKCSGTVEWNLSGVASGSYFVALKTTHGTVVKRVIKQ